MAYSGLYAEKCKINLKNSISTPNWCYYTGVRLGFVSIARLAGDM